MDKNYLQFKGNNPFASQLKMLYHWSRVNDYLVKGDCWPIFMEIDLTDKCNLNCSWCISSNCRGTEQLKVDYLVDFLKEFKIYGGKAITWSGGGEPTLHPNFEEIVNKVKRLGLEMGLMTNGNYPINYNQVISHCKWVRFSLDTMNVEHYKKWKGINALPKVLDNIAHLCEYDLKVGINCNVHEDLTIEEVDQLIYTFEYMVDYIQFRPILPRYYEKEEIKLNNVVWQHLYDKYRNHSLINFSSDKLEDLYKNNEFNYRSCEGHFFNPVLRADGTLATCMYHPNDDKFTFGNIYKNTFSAIWLSQKRKEVIEYLRKEFNYRENCQRCCKLNEINKFIDVLKTPPAKELDVNFL